MWTDLRTRVKLWFSFRVRFYKETVVGEFQRSRGYQIMTALSALYFVFTLFVNTNFANPVPSWSGRTRIILFLLSLVSFLLLTLEATARGYQRESSTVVDFKIEIDEILIRHWSGRRTIDCFLNLTVHNDTKNRSNLINPTLFIEIEDRSNTYQTKVLVDLKEFGLRRVQFKWDPDCYHDVEEGVGKLERLSDIRPKISRPLTKGRIEVGWIGFTCHNFPLAWDNRKVDVEEYSVKNDEPRFSAVKGVRLCMLDASGVEHCGVKEKEEHNDPTTYFTLITRGKRIERWQVNDKDLSVDLAAQ